MKQLKIKIVKIKDELFSHVIILNDEYYFWHYNKNTKKFIYLNKQIFQILRSKKKAILYSKSYYNLIRNFAKYRLQFDDIKIKKIKKDLINYKSLTHIEDMQ